MHLLSYVEINIQCYYYITSLPCQCYSESAPKYNLRALIFIIFCGIPHADPPALHAVHYNMTINRKSLLIEAYKHNFNLTTPVLVATALHML